MGNASLPALLVWKVRQTSGDQDANRRTRNYDVVLRAMIATRALTSIDARNHLNAAM